MTTFAFMAFTLIIFGAAGVGFYLYGETRLTNMVKNFGRNERKKRLKLEAKMLELDKAHGAEIEALRNAIRQLSTKSTKDGLDPITSDYPWRERMERRAAEASKEFVAIDNKIEKVA